MLEKKYRSYVQCSHCGNIYAIKKQLNIEETYITSTCPQCSWTRGLCLGESREDIYELYDVSFDRRYYDYR